jgi:hypothetical protein
MTVWTAQRIPSMVLTCPPVLPILIVRYLIFYFILFFSVRYKPQNPSTVGIRTLLNQFTVYGISRLELFLSDLIRLLYAVFF